MDEIDDHRRRVTRTTPVRADAEGLFVPVDELDGASIGDLVLVSGPDDEEPRPGVVAEVTEGQDGTFFRVDLDRVR